MRPLRFRFMRRGIVGFGVCVCVVVACSASGDGANSRPGSGGSSAAAGSGADAGVAASSGSGGSGATGGSGTTGGSGGSSGSGISVDAAGGTGGLGANPGTGGGSSGCGVNVPTDQPVNEQCDGLDNNLNGFVDETCPCTLGQTQPCFGGYPSQSTAANCHKGTQTCAGTPEFPSWGPCQDWSCDDLPPEQEVCIDSATGSTSGNGVDDDCDGLTDEGCALNVPVFLDGDCLSAFCPQQAPYPIGCNITFEGGDSRGCVSTAPGGSEVYFQEGDACCIVIIPTDCGNVSGTLLCSTVQGPALNATNCPMNKQTAIYPVSGGSPKYGCP
jgi:hypothetical protein